MLFTEAIDSQNIVGNEYKYEDEYIEVEVEIEKSFNVASEDVTSWDLIIEKCEKILIEKSKDLKIASYWLYATWMVEGWGVFEKNLLIYTEFIEKFSKNLFPKAAKRKLKIFQWTEKIFEPHILKKLEELDKERLIKLKDLLERFTGAVEDSLSPEIEKVEIFKDVKKEILSKIDFLEREEEELKRVQELKLQEEEKRLAQEKALQEEKLKRRSEEEEILSKFMLSNTFSQTPSSNLKNEKKLEIETVIKLKDKWVEFTKELYRNSAVDYMTYMSLLSFSEILLENDTFWSESYIDFLLPSEDVVEAARQLIFTDTISKEQLDAVVEQLYTRPAWLEGYYIIFNILYKNGFSDDAARLEKALIYIIHKKKELIDLDIASRQFMSNDMKMWSNKKILTICAESSGNFEYQIVYQEVLRIRNEKGIKSAIEFLEDNFHKSRSEEERFRWKLLFVEFALEIGEKMLALSLLLDLEELIEKFGLDKWQPDLAIATYEMMLRPIISQELGQVGKDRIYKKLCILDVKKVVNC